MYIHWPRRPTDVRPLILWNRMYSTDGLRYCVLPPSTARSIDAVTFLPVVGKMGLSTVFWTNVGTTLLMVRVPPCPISSESTRNGLRLICSRCVSVNWLKSPSDDSRLQPVGL